MIPLLNEINLWTTCQQRMQFAALRSYRARTSALLSDAIVAFERATDISFQFQLQKEGVK